MVLGLAASLARPAPAETAATDPEPSEAVVATVDGDPIRASEVARAIALRLAEPRPEEDPAEFRRRVLDRVIGERLCWREIEAFGFDLLPPDEIDAQRAALAARLGGRRALERTLAELELTAEGLGELLTRHALIRIFAEERLGSQGLIPLEEIERHYRQVLAPDLKRRRQPVPAFEEAQETIRQELREGRLASEIERWMEELRAAAEVETFYDRLPLPAAADGPPG